LALQSARTSLGVAVVATNSLYEDALYYQDYRCVYHHFAAYARHHKSMIAPGVGWLGEASV
ncbi:hypothetical protein AB0J68_23765, partial [Micromonospora sp. NPDC049580]|uniref:hypothetical protein n=1 Tax=Micromonospora sp. NPDC049580 TaxID=3154832 RepID=UPI00343006F5